MHVSSFPYLVTKRDTERCPETETCWYISSRRRPLHTLSYLSGEEGEKGHGRTYIRTSAYRDFAVRGHQLTYSIVLRCSRTVPLSSVTPRLDTFHVFPLLLFSRCQSRTFFAAPFEKDPVSEDRSYTSSGMALAIKLLLVVCAIVVCSAETEEGQSGRSRVSDEQLNVALSDQRYLRRQLKCALGEAPCDPVGRRLKSLAPLVLRGSCPQCSPEETRQIKKVLSHIQRTYPKEWSKIVQQYAGVS